MLEAPLPPDEARRLEVLRDLGLLDTAPDERFDRITRLAAALFGVPMAFVTLVDSERNWFKSRVGLDLDAIPRSFAFCARAILERDVLVIEDAGSDPRYADNPYVTGAPHVRFYAGHPLATPDGSCLGTLCVLDTAPRGFGARERRLLADLAAVLDGEFAQAWAAARRERAEQLQRAQQAWLETVLECLPDGVITLDASGFLLSANPAAQRLLGGPEVALVGRPAQHFVLERAAGLAAGLRAGPILEQVATARRLDGATFPIEFSLSAMLLGGQRHYCAVFRDIARRQEEQARLEAVDARRRKNFATATHELRTPMASVLGFSELLLKRDFDPATSRELVEIIHRQAGVLVTLVNQLLDLSRIEAGGKEALRVAPLDVADLLGRALDAIEGLGQNGRIGIDIDVGLAPVVGDADRLQMALVNILNNSIKYSAPGTPIAVRAFASQNGKLAAVAIRISDQGIGMTPEQQQRIYEAFYRADTVTTTQGSGLGMAIFKEIIDLHNGTVEIASVLGKGTAVTVILPAAGAVRPNSAHR
ncbi:GAF domain-containing sensor histidine kinase [Massilia sp. G4R7]|uniref:histidine kinase n=1 Tax=Massilia phyllostachyos TaxID=2898585 RepID=A0ABS8Q9M6_9BURK|nr:ATP-binding protein [Massilia phyllostachyos]MCD2518459.1 GAF domain-containing sensor histidine kinase [Massilia phyllostachyos]